MEGVELMGVYKTDANGKLVKLAGNVSNADINALSMLPSDNTIDVTVKVDGYYQAPINGYFTMQTTGSTYQSIMVALTSTGNYTLRSRSTRPQAGVLRDFVPVRKGQYVFTEFGGTLQVAIFVPAVEV
jgi:hypothetical protein